MGVNDEYSRDAYTGNHYAYDSDSSDEFDSQLDPEDWQDVYSQELLNGWMTIRGWLESSYLTPRVTYNEFVHFVLSPTHWTSEDPPTSACLEVWREISKIGVITDRVRFEHFAVWFKYNIE